MADLLTIATTASKTFQRALDITGHNVANVNTEGYSRQRVEIASNAPQIYGISFTGGGSKVDTIERVYADYVWREKLAATHLYERYDSALENAKSLEGVVASNDTGVQTFVQRFFDSLQNLANEPLNEANRQTVLNEATNLESHIQNISSFVHDHQTQANAQIKALVKSVNSQLSVIQMANEAVFKAKTAGKFPPNDMLDKRDQAIMELSKLIDVKTYEQPNGYMEVYTGNGKLPLLGDNTLNPLTAERSPFTHEGRFEVYMQIGDQKKVVSDFISGGQLGGVLDYRKNMLDPAERELGLTLNALSNSINIQHHQGWDLNDNQGGDFFQPLYTESYARNTNSETDGSLITAEFVPVTADPANPADFSDIADYKAREYLLRYDDDIGAFHVLDRVTGQPVKDNGGNEITIAPGTSKTVDGLKFTVDNGAYADRDEFVLKPHQQMLEDFKHIITNTNEIATRGKDPNGTGPAEVGDNTNAANLANLASKKLLYRGPANEPETTLLGGYSKMAANIGLYTKSTSIKLDAQTNVLDQITQRMDSISGVNLDEEAANLMRFQQAYQASAQMIQVSNKIFDALMGVLR